MSLLERKQLLLFLVMYISQFFLFPLPQAFSLQTTSTFTCIENNYVVHFSVCVACLLSATGYSVHDQC